MKSIMMLAAIAAVSGAFASDCTLAPKTASQAAAVYAWRFTGRTTEGALVSKSMGSGTACVIAPAAQSCYIRVPAALAIQGYTYICDNCCESFKDGTGGWTLSQFYITRPHQSGLTANITFDAAHIIGVAAAQYEVVGNAQFATTASGISEKYTLTFAGLGSWSKALASPVAISGNFAGKLESPFYVNSRTHICAPADYWTCALVFAGDDGAPSPAYGVWSARYNAAASANYLRGYTVGVPSWAK